MTARSDVIFRRTYSRPLDNGGFESFTDVINRVIKHQTWLWERALGRPVGPVEIQELAELRDLMIATKALVAGRTLWLGGTEVASRREASNFNCAFLRIETVHDFVDAFWLLLQGCGVGFAPVFGTLSGFTYPIPVIEVIRSQRTSKGGLEYSQETIEDGVWTIRIGDSAESWAKAIGKILAGKHRAYKLVIDLSEIRPAGERLKGYGWISAGDELFSKAWESIVKLMNSRAGQLLSKMDIMDIMNHLGTVLSSRRSAEITLMQYGDPEWKSFAEAKKDYWKDNPQRGQSNNSLLFYDKPSQAQLKEVFGIMTDSGGSEPGFINGAEARRRAPWFRGVNPCVPGDTRILTDSGYVRIDSVAGVPTNIWNGETWETVTPFSTGVNPIMRVSLSDGNYLDCTPYHQFVLRDNERVEACMLQEGDQLEKFAMPVITTGKEFPGVDAYSQGFYSGDGNAGYRWSFVYDTKAECLDRLTGTYYPEAAHSRYRWKHGDMKAKDWVPLNGTLEFRLEWLAGLIDADGTVTRDANGNGIQITSVNKPFLDETRLLLTTLGVRAKVVSGAEEGMRPLPDGSGGSKNYPCQKGYRLLIGNSDTYALMELGLRTSRVKLHGNPPQRDARRFVYVTKVESLNYDIETFCFTEPKTNRGTFEGIVTGQCAEILLANKGFCNLVEVNAAAFKDDWYGFQRAVYIIARANYRQTLVNLEDGILQSAWHQNNQFLHLCGVGLTGLVLRDDLSGYHYRVLRNSAVLGAYSMADELGLPRPKNVTTIKPSGTLSKVMDTTEGIHKPLGRFIFNNVIFSKHEPIVNTLRDAGYRVFDHPSDPTSVLVTFPVDWSGVKFDTVNGKEVNLESAVTQLERYRLLMDNWCDQNVSCTVSYSQEEVPDIIEWMDRHWDSYVGVSFLFRADPTKTAKDLGFPYLPQEVVNERDFADYASRLRKVDVTQTGAVDELDDPECASGVCPIR